MTYCTYIHYTVTLFSSKPRERGPMDVLFYLITRYGTYFQTIAFSLDLNLALPFIHTTWTPAVVGGVGMRILQIKKFTLTHNTMIVVEMSDSNDKKQELTRRERPRRKFFWVIVNHNATRTQMIFAAIFFIE